MFSKLVVGGGTFSKQYNDNPEGMSIEDILRETLVKNREIFNTVDTSPYYGNSEVLLGQALAKLKIPREQLNICTKVGRIGMEEFNYSKEHVRFSVNRSIDRLLQGVPPLDVVYLHDVEFQTREQCVEALQELEKLKGEGLIRNVGISGYPLQYLYELVEFVHGRKIVQIDYVLSYCHLNLQNVMLDDYFEKFTRNLGVKQVVNASVLSMSLLRSQGTMSFHPASPELKRLIQEAAVYCKKTSNNKVELADLAIKYALCKWGERGPTVIGFSNADEVRDALSDLKELESQAGQLTGEEQSMVEHIQGKILTARYMNATWDSGQVKGTLNGY